MEKRALDAEKDSTDLQGCTKKTRPSKEWWGDVGEESESNFLENAGSCLKKKDVLCSDILLGGGFKYFLFSPLPGEMIQFD